MKSKRKWWVALIGIVMIVIGVRGGSGHTKAMRVPNGRNASGGETVRENAPAAAFKERGQTGESNRNSVEPAAAKSDPVTNWGAFNGGSSVASGGGLRVALTVGQGVVASRMSNGSDRVDLGFWAGADIADRVPPSLFFGMVPNPVLTFSVDLVAKPSEKLRDTILALVSIGQTTDSLHLDRRIVSSDGDLYSSRYLFTNDGTGRVIVSGTDLAGNGGADTTPVSAYRINAGASMVAFSYDHRFQVRQTREAGSGPMLIASYPAPSPTEKFGVPGWTPLGASTRVLVSGAKSDGRIELSYHADTPMDTSLRVIALFQLTKAGWLPLQTRHNLTTGDFVAYADSLGTILAAAAPTEWNDQPTGDSVVSGEPAGLGLPRKHTLNQNFPNPFNPSTTLSFDVAEGTSGSHSRTTIDIINVLGQPVAVVLQDDLPAGRYTVSWNGTDRGGRPVASGMYFARMTVGGEVFTIKMVMMK